MGNNPRVVIGLGIVAVLGVVLIVLGNPVVGGVAIVVAVAGVVLFLRSGRTGEDEFLEAPDRPDRPARTPRRTDAPAVVEPLPTYEHTYEAEDEEEGEGLPSWGGGEPLTAWTPPEDLDEEADEGAVYEAAQDEWYEDEQEAADEGTMLEEFEELDFGADDSFATLDEEFEELVEEEEEPAAEPLPAFEPLPTFEFTEAELAHEPPPVSDKPKAGGFSFGNNSLIKEIEDVHTDDDIMKSSAATELALSSDKGENSELARLLAKVQSRLAAYD